MNQFVLLAVTMSCSLLGTLSRNQYSKAEMRSSAHNAQFITWLSLAGLAALVVIGAVRGTLTVPSVYTVLLGVVFGGVITAFNLFNSLALKHGPLAYTTLIMAAAAIIPALSGAIAFGEVITWKQIAGTALMAISVFLAVDRSGNARKASYRWLLFCLAAFLMNGSIGVLQKIHQSSDARGELDMFLIVAFAVSTVFSMLLTRAPHAEKKETFGGKALLLAVAAGVFNAGNHVINLYLSGVMDSMIFFPMVNGVGLLLSILAAVIVFRERLKRLQWTGIAVGFAAVLLLCGLI